MVDDDFQRLLKEIRAARAPLPPEHRELLDQMGVQETVIDDWPEGVIDCMRRSVSPRRHAMN